MLLDIAVDERVGVDEAELAAQRLDVGAFAREECPAWLHAKGLGVALEDRGRIELRLQRNRVHEDVAADPLAEEPLHFDEVGGHPWADFAATGVHEIDDDKLARDEVVVEPHGLVLVRSQSDVGEIAHPWAGGRAARAPKAESPRRKERKGATQE